MLEDIRDKKFWLKRKHATGARIGLHQPTFLKKLLSIIRVAKKMQGHQVLLCKKHDLNY